MVGVHLWAVQCTTFHLKPAKRATIFHVLDHGLYTRWFFQLGLRTDGTMLISVCAILVSSKSTECPKIYRKSVLQLLKYTANLCFGRCIIDLSQIWGHPVKMLNIHEQFFTFHRRTTITKEPSYQLTMFWTWRNGYIFCFLFIFMVKRYITCPNLVEYYQFI